VSRAKLTKDRRYGVLGGAPFRQVLDFVAAR
jgi:hypothetical protein